MAKGAVSAVPAAGVALFTLFFFLPIGVFLAGSLSEAGSLREVLEGVLPSLPAVFRFTAGQAAVSAAASCLLALPGAWYAARFDFPLKRFFLSLSLVPFVLPSIIVVICMISFYGRAGLLNRLFGTEFNLVYNLNGIIIAHVFYNFSLAVRIIADGWSRMGDRYREAAASLGDGRIRSFFRITLPLLSPSILTAFLLVFIYCFFSFGIILVFGGVRYETFEVRVFQEMYVRLDFARAAAFSLIQLLCSAAFILLGAGTIRETGTGERRTWDTAERRLADEPLRTRIPAVLYGLFILTFVFGPLVTMVGRAFTVNGSLSARNMLSLFRPGVSTRNVEGILRTSVGQVIGTSIGLALLCGLLAFSLALSIAWALRRKRSAALESFFQIPMGISAVTFGIGLRILFGAVIPYFPLVVIGQVFTAFPFVFRIVKTTVDGLRESYIESARSLGASRWEILTGITLPVLRRGLLNAFAYSTAIPFADLTIVLSVSRGEIVTFPVAIYRLIGFRSFDLALSLSVLYIAVCLVLFLWIDHTSGNPGKEKR